MGGMNRGGVGLRTDVSVNEMLPQNPLLTEDPSNDSEFEIHFTLEFKDPTAASEPEPDVGESQDETAETLTTPDTTDEVPV